MKTEKNKANLRGHNAQLRPKKGMRATKSLGHVILVGLEEGDDVTTTFGTFSLPANRGSFKGRSPQTGNEAKIAAKNVVKFKPSKAFSDKVK